MSMRELAEAIGALTATAREGRTQPAEMAGGTITITNVGVFGVDAGTPILNPGEAAILAFGTIRKQPWVVTAADGRTSIAIRAASPRSRFASTTGSSTASSGRYLADVAAILADPARGLSGAEPAPHGRRLERSDPMAPDVVAWGLVRPAVVLRPRIGLGPVGGGRVRHAHVRPAHSC